MADEELDRLTEGSQADDGTPYAMLGKKPPPPCPGCDQPLPATEAVCPKCNYHRSSGKREPRLYEPFDETWEAGVGLRTRLVAFAVCQALNLLTYVLIDHWGGDAAAAFGSWAAFALMQAFVLGTYDRVRIVRTRRGKVTITKTWRVCFIPLKPKQLDWRGCEEVGVRRDDIGLLEWWMLLVMLGYGIIPGIFWWWYVIRTDRHAAVLTKDLSQLVHCMYAGTDADKAEEIATAVHELTGLPYKAVA